MWRRSPKAEQSRAGVRAERGPEFEKIAGRDRFHLRQAGEGVEANAQT